MTDAETSTSLQHKKKKHPTFSETEWTLPKLSSRTTKQKQNFNECVERISTMVSGRDIS